MQSTITATDACFDFALDLFVTQLKQTLTNTVLHLRLKRDVISFKPRNDTIKLEAIVINGPEIIFGSMKLEFEIDGFNLSLQEFSSVRELRKNKELKNECIATGVIMLVQKDGTAFSSVEGCKIIHRFTRFLTFVRGAYCGVGHMISSNEALETKILHLGFTKTDPFMLSVGWCDMGVIKSLPEIYAEYSKTIAIEINTQPLLRAIEFYRASNLTREISLEMAIVASHAALETLIPHLLTERAGWSKNLVKSRDISFNDKLRAAAAFICINCDLLEHTADLQDRLKAESNADAYSLISLFRNRIVHPGRSIAYTGLELIGVWNLSQWLCELFLFYWFDYRGPMNDRRNLNGWRGDAVLVPLPSAAP